MEVEFSHSILIKNYVHPHQNPNKKYFWILYHLFHFSGLMVLVDLYQNNLL